MNENDELAQRRKDKEIERHTDLLSKLKDEQKVGPTSFPSSEIHYYLIT